MRIKKRAYSRRSTYMVSPLAADLEKTLASAVIHKASLKDDVVGIVLAG